MQQTGWLSTTTGTGITLTESFYAEWRETALRHLRERTLPRFSFMREYAQQNPDEAPLLEHAWEKWHSTALAWLETPESPAMSFHFIDQHPRSWWFDSLRGQLRTNSASTLWHAVSTKKMEDGTIRGSYMMEGGGSVDPDRTAHYHDHYTDSSGNSLEECLVVMAQNMFDIYGVYGDASSAPVGSDTLDKRYREAHGWSLNES